MLVLYPSIIKEPQQGGLLSLIKDHLIDLSFIDDRYGGSVGRAVEPPDAERQAAFEFGTFDGGA